MGHDLYQSFPEARGVFEEADSILGFPLSQLCFEGSEEVLAQTINAQPAVLAVSTAYLRAIPRLWDKDGDITPSFVAGHSLGEYTALVASKVLDFAQALCLARERGRLMWEAGEEVPGGMAAIIGLDEALVEEICRDRGTEIANINSPGQIVISGTKEALAYATELAKARGARRVIPLKVSGAFHSPLMRSAAEGMSKILSGIPFHNPLISIVANTTAQPLTNARAIKEELLEQLCHPVQWQRSIEYMVDTGVETFIEVGPGEVLTGLIRRISKKVQALNISRIK
jgi:[acyl-carrier-protein] S-malonyltransferase